MISNTNKIKKTSGFTIVELLIVIVVIGILAAITIVAYNGVQKRANNTRIDTISKEIADKAEVFAADNSGAYPATVAAFKAATDTATLSAGAKSAMQPGAVTAAGQVRYCAGPGGYSVTAWDYVTGASQTTVNRSGGTTPVTCATT